MWTNSIYESGVQKGRTEIVDDLNERVNEAIAAERAILQTQRDSLESDRTVLEAEKREFSSLRASTIQMFDARLSDLNRMALEETIRVAEIPSGDLPDAIRSQLDVLRSGVGTPDSGGAERSPDPAGGAAGPQGEILTPVGIHTGP